MHGQSHIRFTNTSSFNKHHSKSRKGSYLKNAGPITLCIFLSHQKHSINNTYCGTEASGRLGYNAVQELPSSPSVNLSAPRLTSKDLDAQFSNSVSGHWKWTSERWYTCWWNERLTLSMIMLTHDVKNTVTMAPMRSNTRAIRITHPVTKKVTIFGFHTNSMAWRYPKKN